MPLFTIILCLPILFSVYMYVLSCGFVVAMPTQVVGSRVQVFGRLQMSGNSNINSLDGGSLYFTSLGQLELQNKTSLVLNGNQGVYVLYCICQL